MDPLDQPGRLLPPKTESELLGRAWRLAGRPLSLLADALRVPVPPDLRRHKGWIGELLELALGSWAGSRAEPDFPELGIELKTVPVGADARPTQSTYVCTANLDGSLAGSWAESRVCEKLACVLWVPIVGDKATPPGDRIVGAPLLWRPEGTELEQLRTDWNEIAELIRGGHLDRLDARVGEALHLRPKAASSRDTTRFLDREGQWVQTGPRGFYLRRTFTEALLARAFG